MIENIDYFYYEPGQYQEVRCKTCNSICDAERNREGATFISYAAQLSGFKSNNTHDRFICPHALKRWHVDATRLYGQIITEVSPTVKKIKMADLSQIVKENLEQQNDPEVDS
jgi:hypothetical protein